MNCQTDKYAVLHAGNFLKNIEALKLPVYAAFKVFFNHPGEVPFGFLRKTERKSLGNAAGNGKL